MENEKYFVMVNNIDAILMKKLFPSLEFLPVHVADLNERPEYQVILTPKVKPPEETPA